MQKKSVILKIVESIYFGIYNAKKRRTYLKENKILSKGSIVFFGDSITDYCDLDTYYPGIYAINRGISGNTTRDLLRRINLSVFEAYPSKVVLLIGINDMMNEGEKPKDVALRYEEILRQIKEHCPKVKIVCQSVYPGWAGNKEKAYRGILFPLDEFTDKIIELNSYIKELCEKYECVYADIHTVLKQKDNTMIHDYSFDGCHPNADGYRVISNELKKYL